MCVCDYDMISIVGGSTTVVIQRTTCVGRSVSNIFEYIFISNNIPNKNYHELALLPDYSYHATYTI